MAYFHETISHSTTGIKTRTIGFQPLAVKITVTQKSATSQTFVHSSVGTTDGILTVCEVQYKDDTAGGRTERISSFSPPTGRIVSHYERVAGVLTEKVAANFDSFTATEVKYNIITADVNYQFHVEAWG